MDEGQNGTSGLNANGNTGGYFNSGFSNAGGSMAPTGLNSLPNGMDEVQYVVDDDGGKKKSKKWLVVGILFGVLLLIAALYVLLKQTGVMEKVISGGKMSNRELVERLSDVNDNLKDLTKDYNNMFDGSGGGSFLMKEDRFDEIEEEYDDAKAIIEQLPDADGTTLNEDNKKAYTNLVSEIQKRYNIAEEGVSLSKRFNEAFLWPIINKTSGTNDLSIRPIGETELSNSDNPKVRNVASEFKELYQIVSNGSTDESINNYVGTHSDLIRHYYECFDLVDDPDGFYEKTNTTIKGFEK